MLTQRLKGLVSHSLDPIMATNRIAVACQDPSKLNLCIGVLRSWDSISGKYVPHTYSSVHRAAKELQPCHDYFDGFGNPEFCSLMHHMVTGSTSTDSSSTMQSLSGTGGIFLAVRLLRYLNYTKIHYPSNGWPVYAPLLKQVGITPIPK